MAIEDSKGYVYRAITALKKEATADLLKAHFDGADACVKRVDRSGIEHFSAATSESLIEDWTEGQIFNEAAEMRWRKTADGFAVLWLTEQPISPDGFVLLKDLPYRAVRPSTKGDHGFLLWGTRLDKGGGRWWEARIPRPLHYPGFPVGNNTHPPQLSYWLYREGETVRWIRLVKLMEVKVNE